ncbi:MAG: DNA-binding response regulator [Planctomycetota bacterium]|nr:MAG: DNA-binding response regulator [Planctomycetota bacterium]
MADATIALIEDEDDLRLALAHMLAQEGFEVLESASGRHGLALVRRTRPDAVLLDVMLPGLDGLSVCRALKADPATASIPVLLLTARDDEADVVDGFDAGADDYIRKPFGRRELTARLRAALRRGRSSSPLHEAGTLRRGPLEIDLDRHEVRLDGRPVYFTPAEFRLLRHLAAHPGRAFTRDALLPRISGPDAIVTPRTVDVHIRALRRKLGRHRGWIETVRGVGYRMRESDPGP